MQFRFERYYANLAPKLTNYLVASGSAYASACDLVQETFLKLWSMREDLVDDDASVSGLVFTIARNLRISAVRHAKFTVLQDEITDADAGTVAPPTPPSDIDYLRKRLDAAFAQLPPLLRDAYTLFQVGELPIREIARLTNAGEGAVKVRIFRAKKKLQELLADCSNLSAVQA